MLEMLREMKPSISIEGDKACYAITKPYDCAKNVTEYRTTITRFPTSVLESLLWGPQETREVLVDVVNEVFFDRTDNLSGQSSDGKLWEFQGRLKLRVEFFDAKPKLYLAQITSLKSFELASSRDIVL